MSDQELPEKLLRQDEVCALVGMNKVQIFREIKRGNFPPALQLAARTVAWKTSAIVEWQNNLPLSVVKADV